MDAISIMPSSLQKEGVAHEYNGSPYFAFGCIFNFDIFGQ